ncbi:MAG: histidinol-phosphate transaminase [Ruminococcaceae bacterium]|nr:histidinol-phosphate transaminase [Oscillospiraceae bacterium]
MSRFFSKKYQNLKAYTPGEQPRDMQYIKLNTNESPYPPSPSVLDAVAEEAGKLALYSDPECTELVREASKLFGVKPTEILMTNGSDEILNFAFMAFCDKEHPIVFPDITYGFYPVFAELNGIPYEKIPLKEDFSIDANDYIGIGKNIVIANPNAPTGLTLTLEEIEKIVASNPENIVIIDEAYVDFGAQSAVCLTKKYENLLVTQTFSKSRSMAGARLGFGIGTASLIADMQTIKYSTNPYNVNRMTMAAGAAALRENAYYMDNCKKIVKTREYTKRALEKMGFSVTDSKANFLFAKSEAVNGETLYTELKKRGVLVRHFSAERICEYNRITVGTQEQMEVFLAKTEEILSEMQ